MSSAGVDAVLFQDPLSPLIPAPTEGLSEPSFGQLSNPAPVSASGAPKGPRRTPRKSLIVVLPENHVVSHDLVSTHLQAATDGEAVDVVLACAGQPRSLAALQRRVRDLQILLAPAGTSNEDLRELAMTQAQGDIVTLLSGTPAPA